MAKKENNYLVSVTRGGKVIDLQYSHNLEDFRAIQLKHTVEKKRDDCEFGIARLSDFCPAMLPPSVNKCIELSRNGNPPNRVICVESGKVFLSVSECSVIMRIPEGSIYESIRRGIKAYGYHFELLPPLKNE